MESSASIQNSLLVKVNSTPPFEEASSSVVQGLNEVNGRIIQVTHYQFLDLGRPATKKDDVDFCEVINLIEAEKMGEAKKVAVMISHLFSKSLALFEIVKYYACERLRPVEGAATKVSEESLDTGVQIAATIPDEEKKSQAFWLLSMGYAEVNLSDKAKKLLPFITDRWRLSKVMAMIVKNYLAANEWEKAKVLAALIPDEKIQLKARNHISSWEDRR